MMDEDQEGTPIEVEATEDKEVGPGKLVKLRAFNLFAARVRDTIKDENRAASGHEIKRIVGQRWAQLGYADKQEFLEEAQRENDLLEKLPVDPNAPKRRRRRRPKAEIEDDGSRKRRGRPRKGENDFNGDNTDGDGINGEGSNGAIPDEEEVPKPKIPRKRANVTGKAVDSGHGGKHGSGTVDGSFDAGYLVTVRVGDTDILFRGVLFEPFVSRQIFMM
jgi:hypothetical protein